MNVVLPMDVGEQETLPVPDEVRELHERCGIYTRQDVVERVLDAVGWTEDQDLSGARLLEPAAGNGAFVVEAAKRLMASASFRNGGLDVAELAGRIRSFELHDGEASDGRRRLTELLSTAGLRLRDARFVAERWLRTGDFLLQDVVPGSFTHVVGNPPYARWSKIPSSLRSIYEARLPRHVAKGDLFLPFLDIGIEALCVGGHLGFVCSDRWEHMAFAQEFRDRRLPEMVIRKNEPLAATAAFERKASIYPSLLVLSRKSARPSRSATTIKGCTLQELGFDIRVGPALGCTDAFVVPPERAGEVEAELLAPWVAASDVRDGVVLDRGRTIICLHDDNGALRDLRRFPKAWRWMSRHRPQLERRAVVQTQGAPWFKPIDRIQAKAWSTPKLLLPELARVPRIALDERGMVPSHGVYAIVPTGPGSDVGRLYERLAAGGLAEALEGKAPKVGGSYVRCYKSVLMRLRFPI